MVRPTSTVQAVSVSPPPLRTRRSRPRSTRARLPEKLFPVPSVTPNSVGAAVPGPNGSWPPRTPNRNGVGPAPTSAPADQLGGLKPPAPDQDRHATVHATRARAPGAPP